MAALTEHTMVSCSTDCTLRVYDVDHGTCVQVLEGHTEAVTAVDTVAGVFVVSASHDKSLRIWDAGDGTCLRTLFGHTRAARCVALADSRTVVSGGADKVCGAHVGAMPNQHRPLHCVGCMACSNAEHPPANTKTAVRKSCLVCSVVLCGAVRCGAVRCGAVRCGAVRCGAVAVHLLLVEEDTPMRPNTFPLVLVPFHFPSAVRRS